MYNGLTTADKGALLDAKARGAEWVARDDDDGDMWAYVDKPNREDGCKVWDANLPCVHGLDILRGHKTPEPVNIDLALAQIAEMESKQKELLSEKASEKGCEDKSETVGDAMVKLWETDKRAFAARFVICKNTYGVKTYCALHGQAARTKYGEVEHDNAAAAIQDELDYLNSAAEVGKNV